MDTQDRNQRRSEQDRNRQNYGESRQGMRSNSDRWSSSIENLSDNMEEISGRTTNTTTGGSAAMIGSASGSSRDYERNPAFRHNSDFERGRSSRPIYEGESRNRDQDYGSGRRENQGRYEQSENYPQQRQARGQNRSYQGQHRTPYQQNRGGEGGHDYGQTSDWNQSHGSNWANEERRRQDQQRSSRAWSGQGRENREFQGQQADYGQSSGYSRTGTTPTYSNRFEEQNQYGRESQRNQGRTYSSQNRGGYSSDRDYNRGGYGSNRERDMGGRRESFGNDYDRNRDRYAGGSSNRGGNPATEGYGGSNDFTGGSLGRSDLGGGPYIGEGYEPHRSYGGSAHYGGSSGRSSGSGQERNRNYGGGYSSGQSSYSGASSYGGGGNYGAGYGPNRTGTQNYSNRSEEGGAYRGERNSYQDRDSDRWERDRNR